MAITFQFALLNGGPSAMVYGCIFVGFGGTAVAYSLAEMASMYVEPFARLCLQSNDANVLQRSGGWSTVPMVGKFRTLCTKILGLDSRYVAILSFPI
jgi:hypothetical protein